MVICFVMFTDFPSPLYEALCQAQRGCTGDPALETPLLGLSAVGAVQGYQAVWCCGTSLVLAEQSVDPTSRLIIGPWQSVTKSAL